MQPPSTDTIPLSALQHFLYCPRQCALIHNEQAWAENRFTAYHLGKNWEHKVEHHGKNDDYNIEGPLWS